MEQISDERFFQHGKIQLGFLERSAAQDRKHLTVFLCGIKPDNGYDFTGSSSAGLRSHFLWVKDEWDGVATWYLCKNFDFQYENAVVALIDSKLHELGLTKDQCTLVGFSKGASAALYLGLKYHYLNIIASAPQTKIGTFARNVFPEVFRHMAGDRYKDDGAAAYALNRLIEELIESNETSTRHNLYLFTSKADPQYSFHVAPYINMLRRFDNFTAFVTDSEFVTNHFSVTNYNIPVIVSLLGLLAENLAPRFPPIVHNGAGAVGATAFD